LGGWVKEHPARSFFNHPTTQPPNHPTRQGGKKDATAQGWLSDEERRKKRAGDGTQGAGLTKKAQLSLLRKDFTMV
jgi:hypothetical protein